MRTQLLLLALFLLVSLALYLWMMPLSFRSATRSGWHRLVHGSECGHSEEREAGENKLGDS